MRDLLSNDALWLAIIASTLAQVLKIFTFWRQTGELNWTRMYETGGMPSSHSAMVGALVAAIGLEEGFGSPYFAIATILAMIVIYDSAGVRRAAGTHARVLNQIIAELLQGHPIQETRLKELLGHTRMEVTVGVLFGIALSVSWLLLLKPLLVS
jgi:acid phosphatase family membrane protein YuiD